MPSLRNDERGATLIEYVILLGVVALGAIGSFRFFGAAVTHAAVREADCIAAASGCARPALDAPPSAGSSAPAPASARGVARETGKIMAGLVTGSAKWVYNTVANTLAFIDTPIDWALEKRGVHYRLAPRPLELNPYEKGASVGLDVVTLAPALGAKLPVVVGGLASAYGKSIDLARAMRARERVAAAVENVGERALPTTVAKETETVAAAIARGFVPDAQRFLGMGWDAEVFLVDVDGAKVAVKVYYEGSTVDLTAFTPPEYGGVPMYGPMKIAVPRRVSNPSEGWTEVDGIGMKYIDGTSLANATVHPESAPPITDAQIEQLEALKKKVVADGVAYHDPNFTNFMIGTDNRVYVIDNSVRPLAEIAADPTGGPDAAAAMNAKTQGRFDSAIEAMREIQAKQRLLQPPR